MSYGEKLFIHYWFQLQKYGQGFFSNIAHMILGMICKLKQPFGILEEFSRRNLIERIFPSKQSRFNKFRK